MLPALLSLILTTAASATTEYRVQPGDVIDVFVSSVPDLQRKVMVGVDGQIALPWVGRIPVGGLALPALRQTLQQALANKAVRNRAFDGRESVFFLNAEEIAVDIAEYGPVYLSGDIARPGELKYRPTMTVHQAIALAGGTDLARFRTGNPFMQSADLRSDYEALSAELTKEHVRLWRLKAELADKPKLEREPSSERAASTTVDVPIQQELELEQFKTRKDDVEKERAHLRRAQKQAETHLAMLKDQRQREAEGAALDTRELETIQALYQKGMVSNVRISDARRSVLMFATRLLQTEVQLAQVGREKEDTLRRIDKLEDTRRLDILREIQDVNVRISVLRAKLNGVSEKLLYTGASQVMLMGGKGPKTEVTISRKTSDGWLRLPSDLETELRPGDVVEIFLKPENVQTAAAP